MPDQIGLLALLVRSFFKLLERKSVTAKRVVKLELKTKTFELSVRMKSRSKPMPK